MPTLQLKQFSNVAKCNTITKLSQKHPVRWIPHTGIFCNGERGMNLTLQYVLIQLFSSTSLDKSTRQATQSSAEDISPNCLT
jgi:hypothetical protein